MILKLHGHPLTPNTRRVFLIAKERNIPYEFVPVDLTISEHKKSAHLEHQPFGLVPYITQDDGFELYESCAIGRYLATLGSGPELIPTEPRALAKFEQAASIGYAHLDPIVNGIIREKLLKPSLGEATDEDRLKELTSQLENKLGVLDAILSKQKYLAGDETTLADIFFISHGDLAFDQFGLGDLEKRPNVQRWWKEISSRPAWLAVKNEA